MPSVVLAKEVLSAGLSDEGLATRILRAAFRDDSRLSYERGVWTRNPEAVAPSDVESDAREAPVEPDRVLLVLEGGRRTGSIPFELVRVAAVRLRGDEVIQGCGGEVDLARPAGEELREAVREILDGAVPVAHDPPGAVAALERWIEQPIPEPLSLRRLAAVRLGLPYRHDFARLAGTLRVSWVDSEDPVATTEALDLCLAALRRPGETIETLRERARGDRAPVPWERFAFDRAFLHDLPETPGTYRFLDREGTLLYVGKARNLRHRLSSYFREGGRRDPRAERLLASLHRIEVEPVGSDLEALLEEARQIAEQGPDANVQRGIRARGGRADRLRSIVILEPAEPPHVLRAYFIRDGEIVDRVPLGPRGGGLRRVRRILEDRFFDPRPGPSASRPAAVDVEIVARWLSTHRDRAVAFDPTHMRTAEEVVMRLRWFLERGTLTEQDGSPVRPR